MTSASGTSKNPPLAPRRRRRPPLTELAAWALSLSFHVVLFGGLYHLVMRVEALPDALPAADARLSHAAAIRELPTAPIRLVTPQAVAQTLPPLPHLEAPPPLATELDSLAELPPVEVPVRHDDRRDPSAVAAAEPSGAIMASFFGEPGDARDIVYVLDISEDLRGYFLETLRELRASINNLKATQRFHVILAKPSGTISEMPARRLVPANAEHKREAMTFLDTAATWPEPGGADPVAAMRRAFAVSPELIYFMSNGDYAPTTPLEPTLAELNRDRAARITTVGFDPPAYGRSLLARIARGHGGQSRIISPPQGGGVNDEPR